MSQQFLKHNCPLNTAELFARERSIEMLSDWLNNYANRVPGTCKACLICGDVGVGKSTLVRVMLKDNYYNVLEYSAIDFRGSRQLKETLNNVIEEDNVSKALRSDFQINQKMAIMIDNVEEISVMEKNGLSELIHVINPLRGKRSVKKSQREQIAGLWSIPIICISSESGDKRSAELKKDCLFLEIPGWTQHESSSYLKRLFAKYEICIGDDDVDCIIGACGSDIRKMLHVVFEGLTNRNLLSFVGDYKKGNSKSDIYKDTEKVLSENVGVTETLFLYNRHRMLLPLMIHENYPKILDTIQDHNVQMTVARKILDGITLSDQIDNFIYDSQSWNLPPYSAMAGVRLPNLTLNANTTFQSLRKKYSIKFTTNLSKTSLQYTNIKIINSLIYRTLKPTFSWEDLITLTEIYDSLKLADPTTAQQLLAQYNFSDDIITKIKKANKIADSLVEKELQKST